MGKGLPQTVRTRCIFSVKGYFYPAYTGSGGNRNTATAVSELGSAVDTSVLQKIGVFRLRLMHV